MSEIFEIQISSWSLVNSLVNRFGGKSHWKAQFWIQIGHSKAKVQISLKTGIVVVRRGLKRLRPGCS